MATAEYPTATEDRCCAPNYKMVPLQNIGFGLKLTVHVQYMCLMYSLHIKDSVASLKLMHLYQRYLLSFKLMR